MMEHRKLGHNGFDVPVIGLGTWHVFDVTGEAEEQCHRVVDAALESGATFMDSSPMYGQAERVLGEALNGRRDKALVATKVWTKNGENIELQIERALEFYDDSIDLYQVHNLYEWETVLVRLKQLKEAGKVRAIGITHYLDSAFPLMMEIMKTGRVDAIQIPYNVIRTEVTQAVLPLAADLGLGVVVMVPLGTGELVRLPVTTEQIAPYKDFGCTTWAQVLLKWIVSDPRVTAVIPATSNPARMRENALAGSGPLFPEHDRKKIQQLARTLT